MLSPQEVQQKALKWWNDGSFLSSWLKNEVYFPKEIPQIGLVKPSETLSNFEKILKEQQALKNESKSDIGFGYVLHWQRINNRQISGNDFIVGISIETEDDFLKFIQKEKEFENFKIAISLLKKDLPQLETWVLYNPLKIIENAEKWVNLIKVCQYFIQNPKPNLYIRELPIDNLHTKFIEENKSIISSLLNYILPTESINTETNDFENRFSLKEKETIIRFRILDESLFINQLSDISLPISQFDKFTLKDTIQKVFIVENEMCFLTFPNVKNSIIIFGKGKAVASLSKISWLYLRPIYYWGDIDTEGFEILSILREFKKDAIAQMMSWDCFQKFSSQGLSEGKNSVKNIPKNLSEAEIELFNHLNSLPKNRCRLEQEKIPQWYVESQVIQL